MSAEDTGHISDEENVTNTTPTQQSEQATEQQTLSEEKQEIKEASAALADSAPSTAEATAAATQRSKHVQAAIDWIAFSAVWQVMLAICFTWFIGWLNLSLAWALWMIPAFLIWQRKIVQRKVAFYVADYNLKMEDKQYPDRETVAWFNRIVRHFWITLSPYMASEISNKSAEALNASLPPMIKKMGIENVIMGSYAPRIFDVKTFKTKDDIVQWEGQLEWRSPDLKMDFAVHTSVGPRIPIRISEPVVVTKVRVWMKLVPRDPFVSVVKICFLDNPEIDVAVKPLVLGPDLLSVPGLSQTVHSMVTTQIHEMLVYPKQLVIDLENKEAVAEVVPELTKKESSSNILTNSAGKMLTGCTNVVGGVGKGVGAVGGGVVKGVGAVGGGVVKGVGNVGGGVAKGVGAVGGGVAKGVGAVGGGVVNCAGAVGGGVTRSVGAVGDALRFGKKKEKKEKEASPSDSHSDHAELKRDKSNKLLSFRNKKDKKEKKEKKERREKKEHKKEKP